jgi:hypothetical protein
MHFCTEKPTKNVAKMSESTLYSRSHPYIGTHQNLINVFPIYVIPQYATDIPPDHITPKKMDIQSTAPKKFSKFLKKQTPLVKQPTLRQFFSEAKVNDTVTNKYPP